MRGGCPPHPLPRYGPSCWILGLRGPRWYPLLGGVVQPEPQSNKQRKAWEAGGRSSTQSPPPVACGRVCVCVWVCACVWGDH